LALPQSSAEQEASAMSERLSMNRPLPDRRSLLAMSAALLAGPALAQSGSEPYKPEDLAVAGPLGDFALGRDDAPVTIYEYASLTCGHCANFHAVGFKHLKEKYIDQGKVRYILREFPLDPLATAGFMLSHCAGGGPRYHAMVDLLFARQRDWTQTDKPVDALLALSRQAGFSQESFRACLSDQKIYDGVNAVRQRGSEKFAVNSTPTFFINGRRVTGALSARELDELIEPLLKG
jgi:protein-disulfide isomerase